MPIIYLQHLHTQPKLSLSPSHSIESVNSVVLAINEELLPRGHIKENLVSLSLLYYPFFFYFIPFLYFCLHFKEASNTPLPIPFCSLSFIFFLFFHRRIELFLSFSFISFVYSQSIRFTIQVSTSTNDQEV